MSTSPVPSPTPGSPLSAKPILEASKQRSDEIIQRTRQKHSHAVVYAIVENQRGVLHRIQYHEHCNWTNDSSRSG
jgi:hypothetical protein